MPLRGSSALCGTSAMCVLILLAGTGAASAAPSAAGDQMMAGGEPVTVTLNMAVDEAAVSTYATAVSTPGNPTFGRHLTLDQMRVRFGASAQQVDRVSTWARGAGLSVSGLDTTGSRLTLTGTATTVGSAFGVGLTRTNTRGGVRVRTTAGRPSVPAGIRGDVRAIAGLSQQVAAPQHVMVPLPAVSSGQSCARFWAEGNNTDVPQKYPSGQQSNVLCGYDGNQLRALYGLSNSDRGGGETIVITGAFNSPTALADANTAFAANGIPALPASRYSVKTYEPSSGDQGCDVAAWNAEQALDIQAIHTIAPDASIVYAAAPDCTALPDTLAAVIADGSMDATIISNSWGIASGEPSDTEYLTAVNMMLARAAILGIGTYFASGDAGDNSTISGSTGPSVLFPASSPWTTAVGGTTSALGGTNQVLWQTGWEAAANTLAGGVWQRLSPPLLAGAGGGESHYFDKPTWQTSTGSRRSVPDLAALADPFTGLLIGVTIDGSYRTGPVGGTSLAAPIVAAMVAVAQARAGGADLGLLAPGLYGKAGSAVLTDVTHVAAGIWTPSLSANQTGSFLLDVDAGVQSLTTGTGYDQVTGLGVPGPGFLTGIVA